MVKISRESNNNVNHPTLAKGELTWDTRTGALRYNRAMEQASGILQRIMADAVAQSLKRLPPEELPQAAWDFAAGRAVAEKTRVLGCEAQTLRVEVADANWRAQLNAMAPQYLARLQPFLAVERIEFELAGPPQTGSTAKTRQGFAAGYAAKDAAPAAGARQEKRTHEGHRKGRSLRRRPG